MNMEAVQNLKFEVKCVFFKLFKQMTAFQLVRFLGLPGTAHTYLQMATYSPGIANPPADQWVL